MENLRFEFRVLSEDGECIVSDWTTIPDANCIDQFGGCSQVDIHVAAGMRAVRKDFIEYLSRELADMGAA